MAVFEIVPNISEGRTTGTIDLAVAAMRAEGIRILHRTSDPVHHRSVITAAGSASQAVAAAVALARVTLERIDLRAHRGAHPRIGALDVLPFVPLEGATLDDAVTLAHRAAARIWRELGIPAILYGAAASAPHRENLADVRRGEFEGLLERSRDARWAFDYGDVPHVSAGVIAVGARQFLLAFNVELETGDLALARSIAATLRERDGGLRSLKALGIRLSDAIVQVSFNITDVDAVPLYRARELVRLAAARHGVRTGRSELIGLAPRRTIERTAAAYKRAGNGSYPTMSNVFDIPVKTIDGAPAGLKNYAGKVLLVVNVASKCGLTPQYAGLEKLYLAQRARGLQILGFPANNFGAQEPGSNSEIADFCSLTYGVTFPMFEKISVLGADRHPLYDALVYAQPAATEKPGSDFKAKLAGYGIVQEKPTDILWNFEKFLIGRDGSVAARFAPDVEPSDPLLLAAIDAELAKPAP